MVFFPDRNILSRPYPVYWAGFRSDTATLQQAGWEFSANQRYNYDTISLLMRHQATGIHARTSEIPNMRYDMCSGSRPPFCVQWLTDRGVEWRRIEPLEMVYEPVDMRPQIVEVKTAEDLNLFAGCMARTQELIVDPNDVGDMMDRILELQDPARQEYYKQQLRQNRAEGVRMSATPRQNFHAQIVSLAA